MEEDEEWSNDDDDEERSDDDVAYDKYSPSIKLAILTCSFAVPHKPPLDRLHPRRIQQTNHRN